MSACGGGEEGRRGKEGGRRCVEYVLSSFFEMINVTATGFVRSAARSRIENVTCDTLFVRAAREQRLHELTDTAAARGTQGRGSGRGGGR